MNKGMYFILLVPILPLLGAFWNKIGAMVLAGLAWAALLGGLLNVLDTKDQWLFIAQIPLMALLTFVSIRMAHLRREENSSDLDASTKNQFETLITRHRALKQAVVQSEKEETQSLQIYGAAKGLAEALSWKDMAPRLSSGIQKVFGGYEFLLFAFDEEGKRKLLHRRGGWSKEFPIEGAPAAAPTFVRPPQTSEVVPLLSVPIYSGQAESRRMNGLLLIKSPTGASEESLLSIGHDFGEQLGMALDKALLFAQMETHSRLDGLTGVLRRQPFMDRLAEEFKRAQVFHTPFSVMMVDIDHFKGVNDSHGHAAGDAVLKRLGELLKESVYETDVVGRYGGEEFILLMPKAQAEGARRKAEQLRQRIEADTITSGFEQLKITVSIGLAHFPTSASSQDQLIAAADKALYQAKETGRNQVIEE